MKRKVGFTLLELVIVLAIIGLMAALTVPAMGRLLAGRKLTSAANLTRSALAGTRNLAATRRKTCSLLIDNINSVMLIYASDKTSGVPAREAIVLPQGTEFKPEHANWFPKVPSGKTLESEIIKFSSDGSIKEVVLNYNNTSKAFFVAAHIVVTDYQQREFVISVVRNTGWVTLE